MNARVRMIAGTEQLARETRYARPGTGSGAVLKEKRIYFDNQWLRGTVYDRARLEPGDRFDGPAVIVEYSATTFLPPGCNASVDEQANIVIDVSS